ATIAASGTYRVTLNAPVTVNSVTLNNQTATLAIAGTNGNLTIVNSIALQAGALQLVNGGTLSGGTLNNVGGVGVLRFDASPGNTLNGVTIPSVSALDLSQTGSVLQLRGGTQIGAGSLSLGSSSVVYLNQTAATTPGLTFVLGRNSTLSAEGGNAAILGANAAGQVTVSVNPGAGQSATLATNQLGANAATVLLNQGTIQFDSAAAGAT